MTRGNRNHRTGAVRPADHHDGISLAHTYAYFSESDSRWVVKVRTLGVDATIISCNARQDARRYAEKWDRTIAKIIAATIDRYGGGDCQPSLFGGDTP